jgi:hypothetical protein
MAAPSTEYGSLKEFTGLPETLEHLRALQSDPSLAPDRAIFDAVDLQVTPANVAALEAALLPSIKTVLATTTQDPAPLFSVTARFLAVKTFEQAIDSVTEEELLASLNSSHPDANRVGLTILHKCAQGNDRASRMAYPVKNPHLVELLIRRWLDSPDVGVGGYAQTVLLDLLRADAQERKIWHLIFDDKRFISLIVTLCSVPQDSTMTPKELKAALRQTSIAQGRLLDWLPYVAATDIQPLTTTPFPGLFSMIPLKVADDMHLGYGLIQWAATSMLDESDELLRLNQFDFLDALVIVMRVSKDDKEFMPRLIRALRVHDPVLLANLDGLPGRVIQDESEELRAYIQKLE